MFSEEQGAATIHAEVTGSGWCAVEQGCWGAWAGLPAGPAPQSDVSPSLSLHEAAAQLGQRQPALRAPIRWHRLQPGRQPPAPAPAEETPSSAGPRRDRSSETSISAKAIPVTKNHRRTRHQAQLENQHRHQLVPQLQVRSCSWPRQSQPCENARPALRESAAIHCAWEGLLGPENLVFSQLAGFFFLVASQTPKDGESCR